MSKKILSMFISLTLVLSIVGFNPTVSYAGYSTDIDAFTYDDFYIPAYDGDNYEYVNGSDPEFTAAEMVTKPFERYSELDELGRVGVAYANVCTDIMPTDGEERGDISDIYPTGWHSIKYDIVPASYLYNRCHLIGYQLSAENDNEKNLFTGTRNLNVDSMLYFENMVADYVEETGNHVLYRVTPIFEDDNLLATGVLIEAESVEDDEIEICAFCYNVQEGISIDYETGESALTDDVTEKVTMSDCNVTLGSSSFIYNKTARKPAVTVKHNGKTLVNGKDYTLTYKNNVNVGTGKAIVTGKGKYTGTVTKTFKITAKSITGLIFVKIPNKAYTGKQVKPAVTVKFGSKVLAKGTDYTVKYGTNKNTGKGTVTITGKGNYKGTKKMTFNIVPKAPVFKSTSSKKNSITVKWSKPTGTTGFQVAYRKMGNSSYKFISTTGMTKTFTGLSQGKNYQVKVRAYKTIDGVKCYGNWSAVKQIKTKGAAVSKPAPPASDNNVTNTVYTTATGTKYHCTKSCSGLSRAKEIFTTTLSKAKASGLTPCSNCY